MGELNYKFSDLYPNWGGADTSELAVPEVDDQEALNENPKIASDTSAKEAKGKNIFWAFVVLVALIIFFGGK